MNIDVRIYGYADDDSTIVCVPCAPERPELNGLHGLFSDADDGYGLTCDHCGEYIFEPTICGECDQPLWEHEDLIGARGYCPDQPRAWVRVVEAEAPLSNVKVYFEEVAGEGEHALRSMIAYLGGKVATVTLEDPS